MKKLKIKVLRSQSKEIAQKIWSGELPPETSDYEVIRELWKIADSQGGEIECFRMENHRITGEPTEIIFDHEMVRIAILRGVEMG